MIKLFTDLNWYPKLINGSTQNVIKVFLGSVGIISLVSGAVASYQAKDQLLQIAKNTTDEIVVSYPQNLTISWDGSQLLLEPAPTDPVSLNWPRGWKTTEMPDLLAVYDPKIDANPTNSTGLQAGRPFFLISPTHVWVSKINAPDWSSEVKLAEIPNLKNLPPQKLNHNQAIEQLGQLQAKLRHWLQTGLLIYPIFKVLTGWWSGFWFSIFEASFIWAIGRIINWKISWAKVVKLSLLIIPVALTMQLLADWLYPNLTWSFFHLTYWIIFALVTLGYPNLLAVSPPAEPTNLE